MSFDVEQIRQRFPGLSRMVGGRPAVFADAPGGTQMPASVAAAMTDYMLRYNANSGGAFVTSEETDRVIMEARVAGGDLLGCRPDEVVFGPNMTTMCFALARALGRDFGPDDSLVVTMLDHDANVAPWLSMAEDTGATVRWVDIDEGGWTLDLDSLDEALSHRPRVVAFTLASNALGTITQAKEIVTRAKAAGAIVVADAVHLAQHRALDVVDLGADVVFCSPYKVFGPHMGVMYARKELLERWSPYKVRPASDAAPDRWETGTSNHEAMAGFIAAVNYVAGLGGDDQVVDRRERIVAGFSAIERHESELSRVFLHGCAELPEIRLFGLTAGRDERTPTFAVRLGDLHPAKLAEQLGESGIFVWDGNYYALAIMERLGLQDTGGAVRIGFCHYNTAAEVERVVDGLRRLS
ncbi:MAG: cysteine desulfurase-like protein [Actinomycetota bacterium]